MSLSLNLLLVGGGVLSGFINSLAGGAAFLLFPLLIATGLTPMVANASLFVGLFPANLVGVIAARRDVDLATAQVPRRALIATAGGLIGSSLLIHFGADAFNRAIPWLLLAATLLFGGAPLMRHALTKGFGQHGFHQHPAVLALVEFVLCVYGGYFGLGMGIVLLAAYSIFGNFNLRRANGIKNLLIAANTVVGIVVYSLAGTIQWPAALTVMVGTAIGGYLSVKFANVVSPTFLRWAMLAWAVLLTARAFWYAHP
ncbi:MAG TPA: sulfite exporter TauE/SafE family protein [Dongiaceae bacterium]|nr:sulfite exporter TauE/SafE family protein [Dongiaceae bacterium]